MGEGRDAEGEERISEFQDSMHKGNIHSGGNAQVSRAACRGAVGDEVELST